MSRPECAGANDDRSDRCDLYDSEGFCRYYGDTWLCEKDGEMHGGEPVERITYCTKRKVKGKRINCGTNPLHMERIPMWCEVVFNGTIREVHNNFYNPEGIIVWADGHMEDPTSGQVQMKDGTMLSKDEYFETTPIGKSFREMIAHIKRLKK